jgi:hypothetical protein
VSFAVDADAWSANDYLAGQSRTLLYSAGKRVGELVRDSPGSSLFYARTLDGKAVGYVSLQHGIARVSEPLTPGPGDGYARTRSGRSWYVNAFTGTPRVHTIGTVRFRTSGVWDAYRGLGSRARQVGYATGPYAALGAVAVLLLPCICA